MNDQAITQFNLNSIRLSKLLKRLAITIELLIIFLGVYAALETDNTEAFSLVKMLLIVMCLCELVKIFTVEALTRKPSFIMGLMAIPALSIGLFLTAQNLLHINSVVQEEDLSKITKEIKLQKNLNEKNYLHEKEIEEIKSNAAKMVGNDAAYQNALILSSVEELEQQIADAKKEITHIIEKNNKTEIASTRLNITSYQNRLAEMQKQSSNLYEKHIRNIDRINNRKLQEMDSTIFGKGSISKYYNNQHQALENDYQGNLKNINQQIAELKNKIFQEEDNLANLKFLTNSNKALVDEQNNIISTLESRKSIMLAKKEATRVQNGDQYNEYGIKIRSIEDTIQHNKTLLLNSNRRIADFKSSHWLFGMASVIYSEDAINLSIEDLKKFTYYFILLTSISLSLLPVFLIMISVKLEKALETKNRQHRVLLEKTYQMMKDIAFYIYKSTYNLSKSTANTGKYILYKKKVDKDYSQKSKQEAKISKLTQQDLKKRSDEKNHENDELKQQLFDERKKNVKLEKENFMLKNKPNKKEAQYIQRNSKIQIPIEQLDSLFSFDFKNYKQHNRELKNVQSIFGKNES